MQFKRPGMFFKLCPVFLRKFGVVIKVEAAVRIDALMDKEVGTLLDLLKDELTVRALENDGL